MSKEANKMAGLAFRFARRELNPNVGSIGELKNVIASRVFRDHGFTNVVNTESDVAGDRPGCRAFVLHLPVTNREFWRVVVATHDSGFDPARSTVNEVFDAIENLKFL
jgi:hypothetical protein